MLNKLLLSLILLLILIAHLIFTSHQAFGAEFDAKKKEKIFENYKIENEKETHFVSIYYTDNTNVYWGQIRKSQHRADPEKTYLALIYDGPMVAFSLKAEKDIVEWGQPIAASVNGVIFERGNALVGTQPIDRIRSTESSLVSLTKPSSRPPGISQTAEWIGSPSGHEVYIDKMKLTENTNQFVMLDIYRDYRLVFYENKEISEKIIPPEILRNIELFIIRNPLFQRDINIQPEVFSIVQSPYLYLLSSGHFLLEKSVLENICEIITDKESERFSLISIDQNTCSDLRG